uniref:Transmembrane protein n=1 Tax=Pithovirus LCPAC101 TaxID=2506586 RepID=A0A481Z4K1_9VIRU|nr:MAG: hypothetical protein LCPAC101_02610 [Pithovirus LCPAC101]
MYTIYFILLFIIFAIICIILISKIYVKKAYNKLVCLRDKDIEYEEKIYDMELEFLKMHRQHKDMLDNIKHIMQN